ncbi:SusC/RagA family TonB-linked outer membrane protein [Puteibacter caeruleilacunae]|nr:SusC/RagA family TonB-linked outer membrane protein [Puteibacter caeruleilacunae]
MKNKIFILVFTLLYMSAPLWAQVDSTAMRNTHKSIHKTEKNILNFEDQLKGKLAGVKVTRRSGMPGEGSNVLVNGFKSLIPGVKPLYVIDGILYDIQANESPVIEGLVNNALAQIDGNDIESIKMLSGAEALKYGSQAGRGVIVINTKNNDHLKTAISFNTAMGVNTLYREKDVLSAQQFNSYAIDVLKSKYELYEFQDEYPYLFYNSDDVAYNNFNRNTNWQDEVYKTSFSQNYNLQVQGGDAIAKYYLSVGYLDDKGIAEETNYNKFSMRFNSNINVTRDFTIDVIATLNEFKSNAIESGYSFNNNPLMSALTRTPMLGVRDLNSDGIEQLAYTRVYGFGVSNPIAILKDNVTYSKGHYISAGLTFNYRFDEQWSTSLGLALNSTKNRQNNFISGRTSKAIAPSYYYNKYAENMTKHFLGEQFFTQFDYELTYQQKDILRGLKATIGARYKESEYENDYAVGINTPNDDFVTLNQASTNDIREVLGDFYGFKLMQFYGNASIGLTDNLSATGYVSIDGNSNVGENTDRYGVFYGGELDYDILQNNDGFMNELNFSLSFMKTGNTEIGNEMTNRYFKSTPFVNIAGLQPLNLANTRLKWEDVYSTQFNVGTRLFGLVDVEFSAFQNKIKDMIVFEKQEEYTGFEGMFVNGGEMKSTGFNLSAIADFNVNKVNVNLYANVAHSNEEITKLPGGNDIITAIPGGTVISRVGGSSYEFYGLEMEKVIATQQEADGYNLQARNGNRYQAGDVKFADNQKDSIINDNDRTLIGDANPDLFGGFGMSLAYAKFALDVNFSYSVGNDVFNYSRMITEGQDALFNQTSNVLNAWTKDGDITDIPRLNYGDPVFNNSFSSRFIEDGSFLKLSDVKVSYDFGVNNKFIKSMKVYARGYNLWFTSKYSGYDPEFSYSDNAAYQGVDYGKMPNPRSFIVGLQIGL